MINIINLCCLPDHKEMQDDKLLPWQHQQQTALQQYLNEGNFQEFQDPSRNIEQILNQSNIDNNYDKRNKRQMPWRQTKSVEIKKREKYSPIDSNVSRIKNNQQKIPESINIIKGTLKMRNYTTRKQQPVKNSWGKKQPFIFDIKGITQGKPLKSTNFQLYEEYPHFSIKEKSKKFSIFQYLKEKVPEAIPRPYTSSNISYQNLTELQHRNKKVKKIQKPECIQINMKEKTRQKIKQRLSQFNNRKQKISCEKQLFKLPIKVDHNDNICAVTTNLQRILRQKEDLRQRKKVSQNSGRIMEIQDDSIHDCKQNMKNTINQRKSIGERQTRAILK